MLTYYMLKYALKSAPAGTLQWISQQPMVIEPRFNISDTLRVMTESFENIRVDLDLDKLFW